MKSFGLPYQGSKNDIAWQIVGNLPSGKRLVDLFGGGGAITHAALLSSKYEKVLYNEIDPSLPDLFLRAVKGEFRNKKLEWCSREEFKEKKESDALISLVYSFGNNRKSYFCNEEVENFKRALHEASYGDFSLLQEIDSSFSPAFFKSEKERQALFKKYIGGNEGNKKIVTETIARYKRIQDLYRLNLFINRLQTSSIDYKDYVYQDGDVVYCDPPYEDTAEYLTSFNSKEFYDWVDSRPYPVYFSSYGISDTRFTKFISLSKRRLLKMTTSKSKVAEEILWTNQKDKPTALSRFCFKR